MEKHAYCSECGRYVSLDGDRCQAGHSAESLRDVRSGPLPAGAAARAATPPASAGTKMSDSAQRAASAPSPERSENAGRVLGWVLVVVPALGLGVIMVAITEPQYEGAGLGTTGAWVAAFLTVVVTLGAALGWGWLRFTRRQR